ncbi:MAG TPA: hypothetical protein ENK88_03095 [Campylobacterales bacterium]|nr:hypothetical protein [Campylobacterales bacterium]
MKQIIAIITVMLLIGTLYAKNQIMDIAGDSIKEKVKIKNIRNGHVYNQEIYVIEDSNKTESSTMGVQSNQQHITHYAFANGNRFDSKSEIMVKFKSESHIDIENIEKKYHLKLKRKMNSGDYLFENLGANTFDIINLLITDEANSIERVSPNMILNMKPM